MLNVDSESSDPPCRAPVKPPGTDATKMDLNHMIDIIRICYEGKQQGQSNGKSSQKGLYGVASPASARQPSPAQRQA
jgi:hypothetical protein